MPVSMLGAAAADLVRSSPCLAGCPEAWEEGSTGKSQPGYEFRGVGSGTFPSPNRVCPENITDGQTDGGSSILVLI